MASSFWFTFEATLSELNLSSSLTILLFDYLFSTLTITITLTANLTFNLNADLLNSRSLHGAHVPIKPACSSTHKPH